MPTHSELLTHPEPVVLDPAVDPHARVALLAYVMSLEADAAEHLDSTSPTGTFQAWLLLDRARSLLGPVGVADALRLASLTESATEQVGELDQLDDRPIHTVALAGGVL